MNRTDRLLTMVMLLQSRRVITAAQLAEHFGITERTVYRDLAALAETGVPVVGEAGVGYSLSKRSYHLPPVMFSPHEALALVTGGLLSESMTDASMRDDVRDFRVDRIVRCQALPETADPRPDFDIGEYFERCMAPDPDRVAVIELPAHLLETTRRTGGTC